MAAAERQEADELVLRDLPGKLALLIFAAATLALGWELWGVLFRFSWPLLQPALGPNDTLGVTLFAAGWSALLIGLLLLRHHRQLRPQ